MSTSTFKTVMLWLTILVALFLVWHVAQMTKKDIGINFSEFMADVEDGKVAGSHDHGDRHPGQVHEPPSPSAPRPPPATTSWWTPCSPRRSR